MMLNFFLSILEVTSGMAVLILLLLPLLKTFCKRITARCRYILWILVLLRLAIPVSIGFLPALIEVPLLPEEVELYPMETTDTPVRTDVPAYTPVAPAPTPVLDPTTPVQSEELVVPAPVVEAEKTFDRVTVFTIASYVYLTGGVVFLLWNLLSYAIYTRKLLRHSKAPDERTMEIYQAICRKHGIVHPPMLCVSTYATSPAAFGLFSRHIVLPDIHFSENGLAGTLSHEIMHSKRGDLFVKVLALLARSLHWFDPLAHIAAFRCEMEMELSCDEAVLAGCDEDTRAAYGEVMLDIIRRCRRTRGVLTTHFNPHKSAVKARFTNILYGSGTKKGRWLIAVCTILCLIAGTAVACRLDTASSENDVTNTLQNMQWNYVLDDTTTLIYAGTDGAFTLYEKQNVSDTTVYIDLVDFSLKLLQHGDDDMLSEVLPLGHSVDDDGTVRLYFRYGIEVGYFYELLLSPSADTANLTYRDIRELTADEATAFDVYAAEMVVLTSYEDLLSYVNQQVMSRDMYDFYHDLLSGNSTIPEYNTLVIEDYTIRFTVPMTTYSTYFNFIVAESGMDTLPVGTYSWQVQDSIDVCIQNMEHYDGVVEKAEFQNDPAVVKLRKFLLSMFSYNTPTYGEAVPHPAIHPYICMAHGSCHWTNSPVSLRKNLGSQTSRPSIWRIG